jgi:hypothetical protein
MSSRLGLAKSSMNARIIDRAVVRATSVASLPKFVLLLFLVASDCKATPGEQFTLVRGKHADVCEAYLARLNATRFEEAPFCDRPENDAISGFATLNREPLAPDVVFDLWPSIASMLKPYANTSDWTLDAAKQELGRNILAWQYDPNVDIQNDGSSQPVIIFRGSRINWGVESSDFACGVLDRRSPQLAFILNKSNGQVDEIASKRVFWRANPPVVDYTVDDKRHEKSIDMPIGQHMSVFKFRNLYYFDTFYDDDGWGDYENKRRRTKGLEKILAVFLNQNGKTHEMCEIRLNY